MPLKSGYHGLTMGRLAEAAECAKGTVYQHFSCKEDLSVALAADRVQLPSDTCPADAV
ncbi:MAG: TetR/AcrR family transcriptional regulator [Candidatus Hydrogenedentes bacterium]|nr:TetR/AcrR family transcriptional regulator [Candidatus Hydrogenedentota bacterium]